MTSRSLAARLLVSAAGTVFLGLFAPAAMAAQSKSFVVGWFLQAAHSYEGDCPEGINPLPEEMFREELKAVGVPQEEIEKVMAGFMGGSSTPETRNAIINRGRIDGKPVNAYNYPSAVPDVGFHEVKGKFAYGFNLDGKSGSANYEDPDTGEKGVDNGYWRAMGCNLNHRGTKEQRPTEWDLHWDNNRDKMPAWLFTITTEDFSKDGPVEVTFQKALERITRDANGYVRADSTFRVDPDPRWKNTPLKGTLKNGMITVDQPGDIHLSGDPYMLTELDMSQAKLRLKLNADGTTEGVLGGYIPWLRVYYVYGSSGYSSETMIGTDLPGAWYALRRHADAYPDPKTGENTAISTAFRIVGVPAYAIPVAVGED